MVWHVCFFPSPSFLFGLAAGYDILVGIVPANGRDSGARY